MDNTPSAPPNPPIYGSAPEKSVLGTLLEWARKPVVWITASVVGVGLVGVTLYLVMPHANSPAAPDSAESASSDTSNQPDTNNKPSTTPIATTNPPASQSTPNPTAPKSSTPKKSTSSTGSSSTGTPSTGGGGSSTPPKSPLALKIMPLGDSITQGGVGGDPRTINSYRLQLWNDLGSDYQVDYVGSIQLGDAQLTDQDENGFSGDCIKTDPCHGDATLYSRTAGWVSTEDPDLVIMQGGGNDFVDPSMTETLVESYMEDWINLVFATKPSVKIIVMGAPQWYPGYSASLQNYVNQQATAGKPIRYINYDDVDFVDGTHPSLAGYITLGDRLAAKVRELFP